MLELTQYPQLMHLYDAISGSLQDDHWTERFLSTIRPGVDLSTIHHKFFLWLISKSDTRSVKEIIRLHQAVIDGEEVSEEQWKTAADACMFSAHCTFSGSIPLAIAAYTGYPHTTLGAVNLASRIGRSWTEMADKLIELLKAV